MDSISVVTVNNDIDEEEAETALIEEGIVWYRNKDQRVLVIMGILTLLFCIGEFVFGILANSLALMSDAFHMLSDVISLAVGFLAIQLSRKVASTHKSYGWIRAEVIGGLINGVFLIAVCFFILLEAIQRFIEPPEIKDPMMIIIVGSAGLAMNVIGLIMFASHRSMSHGHSHGHAHGGETKNHNTEKKEHKHHKQKNHAGESTSLLNNDNDNNDNNNKNKNKDKGGHKHGHNDHEPEEKHGNANLHAVFLHVLGDALGSVGAVGSGLIIQFVKSPYKYYADPLFSVLLTLIILKSSIPLVKHCANILLQSVPEHVEVEELQKSLAHVPGITNIHDLHIWQLSDTKHIATLHIGVDAAADFPTIATTIKNIFHSHGIHNTTIQPEYTVIEGRKRGKSVCEMKCDPECDEKLCCDDTNPLVPRIQGP